MANDTFNSLSRTVLQGNTLGVRGAEAPDGMRDENSAPFRPFPMYSDNVEGNDYAGIYRRTDLQRRWGGSPTEAALSTYEPVSGLGYMSRRGFRGFGDLLDDAWELGKSIGGAIKGDEPPPPVAQKGLEPVVVAIESKTGGGGGGVSKAPPKTGGAAPPPPTQAGMKMSTPMMLAIGALVLGGGFLIYKKSQKKAQYAANRRRSRHRRGRRLDRRLTSVHLTEILIMANDTFNSLSRTVLQGNTLGVRGAEAPDGMRDENSAPMWPMPLYADNVEGNDYAGIYRRTDLQRRWGGSPTEAALSTYEPVSGFGGYLSRRGFRGFGNPCNPFDDDADASACASLVTGGGGGGGGGMTVGGGGGGGGGPDQATACASSGGVWLPNGNAVSSIPHCDFIPGGEKVTTNKPCSKETDCPPGDICAAGSCIHTVGGPCAGIREGGACAGGGRCLGGNCVNPGAGFRWDPKLGWVPGTTPPGGGGGTAKAPPPGGGPPGTQPKQAGLSMPVMLIGGALLLGGGFLLFEAHKKKQAQMRANRRRSYRRGRR